MSDLHLLRRVLLRTPGDHDMDTIALTRGTVERVVAELDRKLSAKSAATAAELNCLADEIDRGCAAYVEDGASELLRAKAAEDIVIANRLRSRATELGGVSP